MARFRRGLVPFLALVAVFGGILRGGRWYHQWATEIRLDTVKPAYYHFEFVEIRLTARAPELLKSATGEPLRAVVLRGGNPVKTIGGLVQTEFRWDPARGALIARWPCPWNAPEGEYQLAVAGSPSAQGWIKTHSFKIARRIPRPLPKRFVALTMETARPFATMKVKKPDGTIGNWKALLDWVEFIGADAFWVMAGQSPGDRPGETWVSYNLPMLPVIAQECRRRGIKFGLYAQCYLTNSRERLDRYQYAEEIEGGKPVFTRAISIMDPKRPGDVAELLKRFKAMPGVDYVGLDYIRNPLGGYELVDEFLREMDWIPRPAGFSALGRGDRMLWLARKKIARKDANFIDAWQWWRAHHMAGIIAGIRREVGDDVGLWAFTLTWEKGWQHGQDSVMFNDAGIDADALMLYEADAQQFEEMIRDWHRYAKRADVQLVVGDVLDWILHQRSAKGPGEFGYRLEKASRDIYADGPAAGLFVHDLNRALWGRLGPYSTLDWMRAAKGVAERYRALADPAAGVPAAH